MLRSGSVQGSVIVHIHTQLDEEAVRLPAAMSTLAATPNIVHD